MTHIPIHYSCMNRWVVNIHGHLHGNYIMYGDGLDKRYYNACVEHTNFRPKLLDEILVETGLKNVSNSNRKSLGL